jgi:transcriptional regulator with XRE-family HTH domain
VTPQDMKKFRTEIKLTQRELAKMIGITLRHYQRLESGETAMTETMAKVVKMELTKLNRKKMTTAQFRSIKDDLTPDEIAGVFKGMSNKIKIYYPAGLAEPRWESPDRIVVQSNQVVVKAKFADGNAYTDIVLARLPRCLKEMIAFVERIKLNEEGQVELDRIIGHTKYILRDLGYY